MNNKIAVIDLGTNTFHLLIAEKQNNHYAIIHQERIAAKLGVGGINQNVITEAAITRALNAMRVFKKRLELWQVKSIFCFGTSAIRNAINKKDLVDQIKNEVGIDVTIISGDEEATLIYKGVSAAVPLTKQPSLIVDIGGGSVEFIIADYKSILWKRSFEIGGQRLIEKFNPHDPITSQEINTMQEFFEIQLVPLLEVLKTYDPHSLLGSSGSFDTLSEIYCHLSKILYDKDSPETPLTLDSFYKIYDMLITKNREERLQIPGMIELRVDMIVVASCLIKFLLDQHPFGTIRVSTYSLKEGVLQNMERT